ncbi:hypothetical protein VPH35_024200 [Triticum aestivum]
MSKDGGPTVAVKLFIDKEKRNVLFAESDKEFVDVLFSFLTMPLGTIVRLFDKRSQVGCLDELYKSVESFGEDHFQTKACKAMLLSPLNAEAIDCNPLKVKIADENPMYRFPDAICGCGTIVQYIGECPPVNGNSKEGGVYAVSIPKFIITDDLQVAPASTRVMFSLIEKYGITGKGEYPGEGAPTQLCQVLLHFFQLIGLLRRALLTKQALTGLYFNVAIPPNATDMCVLPESMLSKQALETDPKFKAIKVRLVHAKDDSLLYADVGQDFVDLVFGLLTTPVGAVLKTFSKLPQTGCIENIYKIVYLLLSPRLAPYFSCSSSNNVLRVEELSPRCLMIGFWGGPMNFMVTDDLHICPFCLINTLEFLRASKVPKGKLVEKDLTLNKTQVLKLVGAAFGTSKALSSVLLPSKK